MATSQGLFEVDGQERPNLTRAILGKTKEVKVFVY